ncbi:hypothetical protein TWF730_001788 [Orbilia blumenaviensis]|uniref:Uncharacterized protein n=1 Tax=Orbilia blumenaviensis TaxID=1796055 RepID=A0AAV9UCR7_9PEZI
MSVAVKLKLACAMASGAESNTHFDRNSAWEMHALEQCSFENKGAKPFGVKMSSGRRLARCRMPRRHIIRPVRPPCTATLNKFLLGGTLVGWQKHDALRASVDRLVVYSRNSNSNATCYIAFAVDENTTPLNPITFN